MIGLCVTCRFWINPQKDWSLGTNVEFATPPDGWRACYKATETGALMATDDPGNAYLVTSPSFGCIQWDARSRHVEAVGRDIDAPIDFGIQNDQRTDKS